MIFVLDEIVKVKPPGKQARLCRITDLRGDTATVVNYTTLSGATHRQALNSRVLPLDCLSKATRRQVRAVQEWLTEGAGAALRAQAKPTPRKRVR